jgi:hypothetical protein
VDISGEFFSPEGTFHGDSLPFSGFDGDFEIQIYVAFAGVALITLGQMWIWRKIWLDLIQENPRTWGPGGLPPGRRLFPSMYDTCRTFEFSQFDHEFARLRSPSSASSPSRIAPIKRVILHWVVRLYLPKSL